MINNGPIPPAPPVYQPKEFKLPKKRPGDLEDSEWHKIQPIPPVAAAKIGIMQRIKNAFSRIWGCISNPYDPTWRSHEKYHHVLKELQVAVREERGKIFALKGLDRELELGEEDPENPAFECKNFLNTAVKLLYDYTNDNPTQTMPGDPMTPRDRYKAFMEAYTAALNTAYYKEQVKEDAGGLSSQAMRELEEKNLYVGALHAIARAQFTGVNITLFLNSLSTKMAKAGNVNPPARMKRREFKDLGPNEQRSALFAAMDSGIKAIDKSAEGIEKAVPENKMFFWTRWFSSLKGENKYFDFDPLNTGGNPANISYQRIYSNGNQVTFIRTPTPLIGNKIHPSFKAFLRTLKAEEKKYAYFNLQDRRQPHEHPTFLKRWTQRLGFGREDIRVSALEALNTHPEFKDVICVITLDKNSPFYWQSNIRKAKALVDQMAVDGKITKTEAAAFKKGISKETHSGSQVEQVIKRYHWEYGRLPLQLCKEKKKFIDDFEKHLFAKDSTSFYIPSPYNQASHRTQVRFILNQIGETYFKGHDLLTPMQRQDFIEIAYDLLEDYYIFAQKANCSSTVCKDFIDRGEGEISQKQGKDLLIEANSVPEESYDSNLLVDMQTWYEMVNALPLWARKRPSVRRERLVQVMSCTLEFAYKNPEDFVHLQQLTLDVSPKNPNPLPPEQREAATIQEAVENYSIHLKQITDQFDHLVLDEAIKIVNGENDLNNYNLQEQQKIIKCLYDCKIHTYEVYFHLDELDKRGRKSSVAWTYWQNNIIKQGLPLPKANTKMGADVNFFHESLNEIHIKFQKMSEILNKLDPLMPELAKMPYISIERRKGQEVKTIKKHKYKKLKKSIIPLPLPHKPEKISRKLGDKSEIYG